MSDGSSKENLFSAESDAGSGAQNPHEVRPEAEGDTTEIRGVRVEDGMSATVSFRSPKDELGSSIFVGENEKTIISRTPPAAPEEYFQSVSLAELAGMLEGKQLDHFLVNQMIGGGGMGAVFRGVDLRLDRSVAIKVIPASKQDPDTLRRFRLEAQAAARLDHPNIARVYYVGEAERWNYIVFEFIDGVNIRELVTLHGPLSIDDAIFYTRQVAEALSHAQDRRVVHRDIKPSNILVTAQGTVKVVDMGLARNTGIEQSTGDATASGVTLGTFDYISPEQARNPRDADTRSDLYSLGCSLFFMLTGKPPFSEGTVLQKLLRHGSVPPPDPRAWRGDISDQLYAILMKLMAKQPAERYQNPAELINDLFLLAEIEELPRSQTAGTVAITPTIAQRSLLEINLPWLVATAFLLGSTLWLQTVQAISSGYSLPDIQSGRLVSADSAERNAAASVTAPETNAVEAQPELQGSADVTRPAEAPPQKPQTIESPYVVSPYLPADVSVDRWATSIADAIVLSGNQAIVNIEVRGLVELQEAIKVSGKQLTIAGTSDFPARIEVADGLLAGLDDWEAVLTIENGSLRLENLDIRLDYAKVSDGIAAGFVSTVGTGKVELASTDVTMVGRLGAERHFVLLVDEVRAPRTLGATAGLSVPTQPGAAELALDNCFFRGYGSLIGLRADLSRSRQFVGSITNSLTALSHFIVDVQHADRSSGSLVERNLRLFCSRSTFFSQAGFASIQYAEFAEPTLSLNRESVSCVFDSAVGSPHLQVLGIGSEGILASLNRFLLKGNDNAYDENIIVLCRGGASVREAVVSFDFTVAAQAGWFEERGNERRVRWVTAPRDDLDLSRATPANFQLPEDRFSPGFLGKTTAIAAPVR